MAYKISDVKFEEIDRRLQELAVTDFALFCEIANIDKKKIIVCMDRMAGKSLQQIANKYDIPKSTIQDICKKCTDIPHKK